MVSAVPFYSKGSTSEETHPNLSHEGAFTNSSESPLKKTSRRQWSVQEEPTTLLRRLRSQLAEDGCSESQYLISKVLLECKDGYEDNCKQAVYWLTQSSLQGYLLATKELQACFSSGLGICEENYEDVKQCLEMDQQEKLAKVAGKQLFCSISDGNEFVSLRKLNQRIFELLDDKTEDSEEKDNCRSDLADDKQSLKGCNLEERFGGERLSESSLVDAAKSYIQGDVPLISINLNYAKYSQLFKNINRTQMACLKQLNKPFDRAFTLPYAYVVLLILLSLSLIYYVDTTVVFYTYILWIVAFSTMLYSATAIMIQHCNISLFNIWSVLLKKVCSDIDVKLATVRFKQKHLQLYLIYIGSMFIYLSTFPLINSSVKKIIFPPLLFTSILMFTALFRSHFIYNTLSSCLYLFSHYVFCHQYFSELLISYIPALEPFVLNESVSLWGYLNLNLNIGSVFHCLWFVSFILVSFTLGITGVLYHFLSVTWFHMLLLMSSDDAYFINSLSFAMWLFIFFLPFMLHLLNTIFPVFIIFHCLLTEGIELETAIIVTLGLAILFLIGAKYFSKFFIMLKAFLVLVSLAFLTHKHLQNSQMISSLKWEQFQNSCLPSKEAIAALTVKNCKPLEGTVVQWQAVVKQVEVESITNWVNDAVSAFPNVVQPYLKCGIGMPPNHCNRELFMTDLEYQQCLLVQFIKGSECSLKNYNNYQFRILVSMDSTFWKFQKTSDVILKGGNEFEEVAFGLSLHDRISFVGTLDKGIGTIVPEIMLSSVSCADCMTKTLHASLQPPFNFDMFSYSLKSTFNFFFSPTFSI